MFFSTACVAPAQRSSAWTDAIRSTCGHFHSEFPADVSADIETRMIGRYPCARIAQTARRVFRSAQDARADDRDQCFVLLQVAGSSLLEQNGRTIGLVPGDISLLDSAAPCEIRLTGRNLQICLHIPKDELDPRLSNWRDRLVTKLPAPVNHLLHSLVASSFGPADLFADQQGEVIAEAVLGLVSTGWSAAPESFVPRDDDPHEEVLRLVKSFIIGHLAEENLSPGAIASATGLSERQLHRMFRRSGQSVSAWVRRCRLDRCAAALRDPRQRGRSITDIAFGCGFNDSAHFSRVFRDEFGASPREYRRAAATPH